MSAYTTWKLSRLPFNKTLHILNAALITRLSRLPFNKILHILNSALITRRLSRFPFNRTPLHQSTATSPTHSHHRGQGFQLLQPPWVVWHPQHYTALHLTPGSSPGPWSVAADSILYTQGHCSNIRDSWLNPVHTRNIVQTSGTAGSTLYQQGTLFKHQGQLTQPCTYKEHCSNIRDSWLNPTHTMNIVQTSGAAG